MIYFFIFFKDERKKFAFHIQWSTNKINAFDIVMKNNPKLESYDTLKSYEVGVWRFLSGVFGNNYKTPKGL